jgi:HemY protein
MLWSLVKIILFVAVIGALTFGAGFLTESGGGIRIELPGQEFNLGPLQAIIALVLLVVAVWVVIKLVSLLIATWRFLNGDETAISRWFNRNRERKGYEALADGMMALASGESKTAMAKAERAERYLQRPELTTLITAQAAEMSGDKPRAEEAYKQLLRDDRTRFVGVRGIMKQKLEEGDTETALKLAEKAFALKPRHGETKDVLLKLQAEKGDWSGARKTLSAKLKHGELPRDVHRRRDAVLALGEAKDIIADGNTIDARVAAIEANRLSPDLVPAAVMAAQSYIEQDKARYATRILKKTWGAQPHPDLAAAFAAINKDETPEQRIKRFTALTRQHPSNPETKMLLAELNIAAKDFAGARTAMGDLAGTDPTARSLTIMAAIERGEGATDEVVKGYLARAVTASRGPQWVCDNCQNIPGAWDPTCDNCGAVDTMTWRTPPLGDVSQQPVAGMLPLIVGQIEEASNASEPEDAEIIEASETAKDISDAVEEAKVETVADGEIIEAPAPEMAKN